MTAERERGIVLNKLMRLRRELDGADAVVIGAGAGLSVSAGFSYTKERFYKYFGDFAEKYHFTDMYSGGFYPFETLEEYWAYWSRYIYVNRYLDAPKPVYEDLLMCLQGKDYFVLTTNVDHCFQKSGFDRQRLFYTQGDYGRWQCSKPCCRKTYANKSAVLEMVEQQKGMRIPKELIPYCPHCGEPMSMNLRADHTFVEDDGWHRAAKRYEDFLAEHRDRKVLFWELGVGYNTPGIIKYPFWQMTCHWKQVVYACVNIESADVPTEIKKKSVCIQADIGVLL